jgi:hypothetical protein
MLGFIWMLLTPKWPASAHVGIPFLGFVVKDKSSVATGQQYAQCEYSKHPHSDLS